MDKLFSTQEAADFLKVTTRTIRNWKQLGKLFPRKTELGKDFYSEEQLGNFLKTNSQTFPNVPNVPSGKLVPCVTGDRGDKFYSFEQLSPLIDTVTGDNRGDKSLKVKDVTRDMSPPNLSPVQTVTEFGRLPKSDFDAEYLRLIKLDIAEAQKHLDELPENQRRGLTLETLRHFGCGYLSDWILTKSRAEFVCGLYVKEFTGEPKHLPPPSKRIIIPTPSMEHLNGVATERLEVNQAYWKQHAGSMELFGDLNAINSDLIVVVEGEVDAMSIWQCSSGQIAVVAILGCGNWKKTLLPKLKELREKKLLLLLDADAAGKKSANKLLADLLARGCLAVTKYLYDVLPKEE